MQKRMKRFADGHCAGVHSVRRAVSKVQGGAFAVQKLMLFVVEGGWEAVQAVRRPWLPSSAAKSAICARDLLAEQKFRKTRRTAESKAQAY